MYEALLNALREKYLKLHGYTEEDVKIKIVRPLFEGLGYEEEWFKYEYPVVRNRQITDITFVKDEKRFMVIEVKKESPKDNDFHQLLGYLNSKNIEWGILTDGKDYYLINNKIDADYKSKRVISYNLFDHAQMQDVRYYSYEYIHVNKITYYLKYLAQFRAYFFREGGNYNSWSEFSSTVQNYFNYLSLEYGFRKIEHLNVDDFRKFVFNYIEKSKGSSRPIRSRATIVKKFRHINRFYEMFSKYSDGSISNPFRHLTEDQMIAGFECKYKDDITEDFTEDIVGLFINYYENHTRNPEKNIIIFLLCLYAGLSRDDIRFLKITHLEDESCSIYLDKRKIRLPKELYSRLRNYIENIRDKKARVSYIFYSNYGKYAGQPLDKNSINNIFSGGAKSVGKALGKQLNVCPENIRKMLVRRFFKAGLTIEEIVTVLDLDIRRVGDYITKDEIIEKTVLDRLCTMHPFRKSFT